MREVAKVLAFHAPDETAPEETRGPEETAPEETRGPEAEGDSNLRGPGEPDSAEAVDLDAAATGMAMLLRLILDAMKSGPTRAQTLPASTIKGGSYSNSRHMPDGNPSWRRGLVKTDHPPDLLRFSG